MRRFILTSIGPKKKWEAFFQILSVFLREDYKFPVLEIFAFLFVLSLLIFGSFNIGGPGNPASYLPMNYVGGSILSFLVFLILIWKNLSTGFGGEFDKGVMQTFLVYPLSRRLILLARLVSAVGVAIGLLLLSQFTVLYLLVRGFFLSNLGAFSYLYLIALGDIFLITALVLLTTVLTKSASAPLVVGILLFFGISILSGFLTGYATQTSNYNLLVATFIIDPFLSLQTYFVPAALNLGGPILQLTTPFWAPTTQNVVPVVVANYVTSAMIVILSFLYFSRRVEP